MSSGATAKSRAGRPSQDESEPDVFAVFGGASTTKFGRARRTVVALPGFMRRRVRIRQFLRLLQPCPAGARAADSAWLACP